jgi:CheY-like chemotaxis protein
MPIMDGFEATKKIREMEKDYCVHIPIIAVTGHDASSAEAKRTIEAGMDAYLVKPLKREDLLEAIRYIDNKGRYV